MDELTSTLPIWAPYAATGASGAILATGLSLATHRARRRTRPPSSAARGGSRVADALTFIVAAVVAGICAQGMAHFLQDKLGFSLPVVIAFGGILELVAFTCALRARRAVRETGAAGVDGIAVWAVAAASGTFAALDSGDAVTGAFRIFLALLAAWLWERGMAIERRYRRKLHRPDKRDDIKWRVTVARVACWLRLAEPQDRTVAEVDIARRLTRLALATARLRTTQTRHRNWFHAAKRAQTRQQKAMREALRHTSLAHDTQLQQRLVAETAALTQAATFAEITHRPFWAKDATPEEPPTSDSRRKAEESAATISLLARVRERRTDRRLGARSAPDRTTERRTEGPIDESAEERTGDHVEARTVPPLTLPSVRPLAVPDAPSGLQWLDGTVLPHAVLNVRAHGIVKIPSVRPVWPLNPLRPADQGPNRPHPARTNDPESARPVAKRERRSKEWWIATLADNIRATTDAGYKWEPTYEGPDGLIARTHYSRSWCEKVVRAARERATHNPQDTEAPLRTGAGVVG